MSDTAPWTAPRFFELLGRLGRLRVISRCGPSVFEALCEVDDFAVGAGHLNAITDDYHWHLGLAGFGHLRSVDQIHKRSGRRVLFFELSGAAGEAPFVMIYLHRAKDAEFDPEREKMFLDAHAELAEGALVHRPEDA